MKKIIDFIKKLSKNDIVVRTTKTFIQAFLGVILAVNVANIDGIDSIKTILISALSAGVCAIWNYLKTLIDEKLTKLN